MHEWRWLRSALPWWIHGISKSQSPYFYVYESCLDPVTTFERWVPLGIDANVFRCLFHRTYRESQLCIVIKRFYVYESIYTNSFLEKLAALVKTLKEWEHNRTLLFCGFDTEQHVVWKAPSQKSFQHHFDQQAQRVLGDSIEDSFLNTSSIQDDSKSAKVLQRLDLFWNARAPDVIEQIGDSIWTRESLGIADASPTSCELAWSGEFSLDVTDTQRIRRHRQSGIGIEWKPARSSEILWLATPMMEKLTRCDSNMFI